MCILSIFSEFSYMAPSIFAEKDFSRILSDVNGYEHLFLDRIRERNWYALVYDNSEYEAYYSPELVKKFYSSIDTTTNSLCTLRLGTSLLLLT